MRVWLAFAAAVIALRAQEVRVTTEFQRPDSAGNVVAVDKMENPREILSPALIRNGFTTFHVIVKAPPGASFFFVVGQNPDNAVTVKLYRPTFGADGIPDALELVTTPVEGTMPPSGALTFVMDVWTGADAPSRRIKVEPQAYIASEQWVTYPMEARILPGIVPVHPVVRFPLPAVTARAEASVLGPLASAVCSDHANTGPVESAAPLTLRSLIQRNAAQDMAIGLKLGPAVLKEAFLWGYGLEQPEAWCSHTPTKPIQGLNAEWYLRLRDYLYKRASSESASER